jgi:hypothetical protein
MLAANLDAMVAGYTDCALWSSIIGEDGEPLDRNHTVADLAPSAVAAFRRDCEDFAALIAAEGIDVSDIEPGKFGHDLWLTRNHHGAGYWDGGLGERGDALTTWAHSMGEADLYVVDDGLIYQYGE